ncbi:DUF7683 domain-containing protein [Fluviicola sp.]|uniref:DUF7683 domain-containing protein n=1 Tax=Fluviicola sp. TaxID=1917219 RepID=UPI003D2AF422
MKTELLIEIFEKVGDGFIKEINISHYDLKQINKICPPEDFPDDFEYCDGHFVTEEQFTMLKEYIVELSIYNYQDYDYNIITRSI